MAFIRSLVLVGLNTLAVTKAQLPLCSTVQAGEKCCDPENPTAETTCKQTITCPKPSNYLQFCRWYNQETPGACCIPGHDADNQDMFENLIDGLGPGCKNPMMYPQIRHFFCLGCDPRQPEYVFDPALWSKDSEDVWSAVEDPPDREDYCFPGLPCWEEDDENATDTGRRMQDEAPPTPILRVCREFADKMWNCETPGNCKNGPDGTHYDTCGVMISNACVAGQISKNHPDQNEDYFIEFGNFDPYQCGDDLVIPSKAYKTIQDFMMTFPPPNLDYFQYEVCEPDGKCYTGRPQEGVTHTDYCPNPTGSDKPNCPCFNGPEDNSPAARFTPSAAMAAIAMSLLSLVSIH